MREPKTLEEKLRYKKTFLGWYIVYVPITGWIATKFNNKKSLSTISRNRTLAVLINKIDNHYSRWGW